MQDIRTYCDDNQLYLVKKERGEDVVRSSLCLRHGPSAFFVKQRLHGIEYPPICLGCSRALKKPNVLVRARRRMEMARERDGILAFQAEERQRQLNKEDGKVEKRPPLPPPLHPFRQWSPRRLLYD